ncbi:dephospho-CoA kinase [Paraglaciecola marina]|uniref:dephospho-CoA kinase n=1 Tax=Paraglaciecola marina TaxID=2500157 RepID=UPI00105D1406|nr:dephospho-CoA kinase [Paraglaciecola marina]
MSQYVVGVSGGIGSGKTTVTNYFKKFNIDVIDADIVARQAVEPGTPGLQAIVGKFGQKILDINGALDRSQLRQLVFSEPENKEWLNQLLHPAIRTEMVKQVQQAKSNYCLLSVPLLVENKLYEMVDRVLIVDVSETNQLKRTLLRDKTNAQQIQAIMDSQASREQRLAVADDVIDNNDSPEKLLIQVELLHQTYLQLAKNKIR